MADWALTVNGVDKSAYVRISAATVNLSRPLNERATLRLDFLPDYYPARLSDIVLYAHDGVTKIFGGILLKRKTKGVADREVKRVTACVCADYSAYGDFRFVTKTYSGLVSLKTVLTYLVATYLASYGVTLDPTQLDGADLDGIVWTRKKLTACLRELKDRTGWIFRIDADKQLKMYAPGTEASAINISDAEPNCQDLTVDDPEELPITLVTCVCGPSGVDEVPWTRTANGTDTSWVMDIPAAHAGGGNRGYVSVGGENKTLSRPGEGGDYEWDVDTSTLSVGTAPTPAFGTVLEFIYTAQFPFTVSDTTGGSPEIEREFEFPTIKQYPAALEALAQKMAEVADQEPRAFNIISREHGWLPGTVATIEKSERGVTPPTSASITQVDLTLNSKLEWTYTIAAQETTTAIASSTLPLGATREFIGSSSSGSSGSSSGGSSTTVISATSPVTLGGSRAISVVMSASTWKPIPERQVLLRQSATRTWQIRCETWTLTPGITLRLRLQNIDDNTTTFESDPITPGNDADHPDVAYLTVVVPAAKEHQLEVLADDTPDDGEEMHAMAAMATT